MNRKMKIILVLAAAMVLAPAAAFANGFMLAEQSANGCGQSGALKAADDDPALIYYNPAGITGLKGLQLQIEATTYIPVASWKPSNGNYPKTSANTWVQAVPTFFATYQDKKVNWITAGIGVFTVFGLGIEWPAKWMMNYEVIKSQLQSTQIVPTLAFGPFKGFSVGVGADFVFGSVDMVQAVPLADGQVHKASLGGSAFAVGYNVGVRYQPHQMVAIGATYRSTVTMLLNPGKMSFDVPPPFQPSMQNQEVYTHLTLPQVAGLGVRVYPIKGLSVELDVNLVAWESYKNITITLTKPLNGTENHIIQTKNWFNAMTLNIGAKYSWKDWRFMAGINVDFNEVPNNTVDPSLPDNNRINWSVGAAYYFWKMHVGLSYMMVNVLPRTTTSTDINAPEPGTYKTMVNDIALEVGFHFL